jgi:peptidyl-prolyl cis-trans isomerase SurA
VTQYLRTVKDCTPPSLHIKIALVICALASFMSARAHLDSLEFQVLDAVVAVVGDEFVLQSDIEAQAFNARAQGMEVNRESECRMMEDLLFQKLLLHNAKLDSIEITEGEVLDEIERRLAYYIQMFGSIEAFESEYGQSVSQWKAEFAEPMKEQLMASRMQGTIDQQVRATPAEVQQAYAETPEDSLPLIPEALSYSEIIMQPAITELQRSATRSTLDSIRTLVEQGKVSMTLAAMRYSEDPGSKYKGGCYTDIQRGQFVPEFEAAVFDTPLGELSSVFSSDFGFHFVKPTDRRGELFSACHVLMSAKVDPMALSALQTEMDSLAEQLDRGIWDFSEAAQRFSTRENSKNQRGQVVNPRDGSTRFGSDELDPNIFFLLDNLEEGAWSIPVELVDEDENGYWAMFRMDRRYMAHRANPRDDFALFQMQVENQLRAEKMNTWLSDHINETYIRIDPPYATCPTDQDWRGITATE